MVAIILAAVAMAVYNLAFFAGIRATGVALALAEPITAVVLAILIVGERPAPISFVGLVLMFAGLSVLIRSEVSGSHSTSTEV